MKFLKFLKPLLALIVLGGGIGFLLMRNKATMEAKAEQPIALAIRVTTAAAMRETFTENLEIIGTMQAQSEVVVVSETQGRVLRVFASLG
jgi:multidrug efflux pump subunit AcrA (membrane-fusion protein)